MEEEANSWIRRTKFSHTVCHRLDAWRLASFPLTIQPDRIPVAKSKPRTSNLNKKPEAMVAQIQQSPTTNKNRSVSPHPETKLSDAFKEARSSQKRFLTPLPQRRGAEKGIVGKLFRKDSCNIKAPNSNSPVSKSPTNISPLRHFASIKFHEKTRSHKDSAWIKYFDHSGGRVTSVETVDEFTVNLSKLFLGLRFAHGAHSQLYHGIYKEQPVAVKIIRVPDDDENGDLGGRLEKQFTREATLLSSLHHENVIKFVAACRKPPVFCTFGASPLVEGPAIIASVLICISPGAQFCILNLLEHVVYELSEKNLSMLDYMLQDQQYAQY
ncbi:uncharacterized protein LOC111368229 [Olea europaea var. sylvestris]|uniref:uncharacterized protein LOC111368229 n=1 Tax=Olea europaea var. sylvestris TaxID=158386 RepID=UPI000C1D3BE3|nr:uncharacterized protein LOC111368229 [Olea europaea var. sylvestris]